MFFNNFGKKRCLAVILAMVLFVSLSFGSCGKKTIDDPAEYFRHVEKETITCGLDGFLTIFDAASKIYGKAGCIGAESSIDIDFSDEALNMIKLFTELDLSFLNNIGIDMSVYADQDMNGVDMKLLLGESELLNADIIVDYAESLLHVSVPEALSKVISVNFVELTGKMLPAVNPTYSEYPDMKELGTLIEKYVDIILSGVTNVEKDEGSVSANGVDQTCSVITVKLTEKEIRAIAKNVLESASSDEDLKNLIVSFGDYIAAVSMSSDELEIDNGEALYESFKTEVDSLISEISQTESDEDADESYIVLTDYVNSDDEIIGRKIESDGEELLSYAVTTEGKNFGLEFGIEGTTLLIGSGTADKTINGTLTVTEEDMDYANIILTNVAPDLSKGVLDIEILELPDGENTELLSSILSVYTVRISFDNSVDKSVSKLSLMNGENEFASVSLSSSLRDVEKPSIPSEEERVEIAEGEDILLYFDFAKLFENMENSPIPSEYVSLAKIYLSMLLQGQ